MPLPFIPIAIAAGSAIAGAVGIGKGIKAASDNSKAGDINKNAQSRVDNAKRYLELTRDATKDALEHLGKKKLEIYDGDMKRFVDFYGLLKNVKIKESPELNELKKFKIDKQSLAEIRQDCELAGEVIGGVASGALAGGLMAFGAYGAATTFAAASTGTAIATLSGAAATNATLAFFGGGALAAGGLGIAGGMAVLGGIVAGPALAIAGFVMGNKAEENLNNAYSNLAKAKEIAEELNVLSAASEAIAKRTRLFSVQLDKLRKLFRPQIDAMVGIVNDEGTDYSRFSPSSQSCIAAVVATAQAVKAILDTPILDKSGALTAESEAILSGTKKFLSGTPKTARRPAKNRDPSKGLD